MGIPGSIQRKTFLASKVSQNMPPGPPASECSGWFVQMQTRISEGESPGINIWIGSPGDYIQIFRFPPSIKVIPISTPTSI